MKLSDDWKFSISNDGEYTKVYGVIYKLTSPSGKIYIGQSTNLINRYYSYNGGGGVKQRKLFLAIKKYGFNNFKKEIICKCFSKTDLDSREIHCINIFNTVKCGYNIFGGGCSPIMTEETRKKISDSNKITKRLNRPIRTKEATEKARLKMVGRKISEDHILKLKESKKKDKNPSFDDTIYCFSKKDTKEKFYGTRYDFYTKYNFNPQMVRFVIFGMAQSVKGWILSKEDGDNVNLPIQRKRKRYDRCKK